MVIYRPWLPAAANRLTETKHFFWTPFSFQRVFVYKANCNSISKVAFSFDPHDVVKVHHGDSSLMDFVYHLLILIYPNFLKGVA